MKAIDIPTKFPIAWASSQVAPYIEAVPTTPSGTPGKASLNLGFPKETFEQIAAGGNPPWGADANGVINQMTAWLRFAAAGGVPVAYDSTFSATIGGYPKGALLQSATAGHYWYSSVDDNVTNPDAAGAGWISFPDLLIQEQKPNYAVDSGITNQVVISLTPAPAAWADIVGAPIRVLVASTNSTTSPTIKINGLVAATMVNSDGTAVGVGQISASNIMEGFPRTDGKFQVSVPVKPPPSPSGASWPIPGFMMPWPTETVPSGFLECNGATLLISSYPNLYAVLGTRYGGDGVNTFRLPDYRGEFLRGWDHGRGLDPNASTRTNAGGGLTGDHVGTNQLGAAGPISLSGGTVKINYPKVNLDGSSFLWDMRDSPSDVSGTDTYKGMLHDGGVPGGIVYYITGTMDISGNSGATETRPVNTYVMWVIAY